MTRRRPLLAAIAAALLLLLVAAVGAIAAAVLWGATIDVSRWRDAAAARATATLGRPVALRGPFELTLGREALLRAGGVEVRNPAGFTTGEFAVLGETRVRFDLLDAVRGALRVRSVDVDAGRLRLERTVDGRASWSFATAPAGGRSPGVGIEVGEITLRRFDVEHDDARAARRFRLAVDELKASGHWDEPLRLSVRGHGAGRSPYTLVLAAGPPRSLFEATLPWPFELAFQHGETRLEAIGTVTAGADAIEVAELRGRVADSEVEGHLTLDLGRARLRVSGAIGVAALPLSSFLDDDAKFSSDAIRAVPVRDLVPLDVEVDLSVRELPGVPGDVRDVTVALRADTASVHAPIRATVAGAPFSGALALDLAAPVPVLAMRLDARDAALRDLAGVLSGPSELAGTLGRLGLRLSARGETIGALARELDLALSAEAVRLRYERGEGVRPIAVTLDALDLSARPGERLAGSARGTLQGARATLSLRGGTLPDMLREQVVPIVAELSAARSKLSIEGTLARPDSGRGSDVAFRLDARRIGDLAPWLAVAPAAKLPLTARGRLRTAAEASYLDGMMVALGRSTVTIDARRDHRAASPLPVVTVRGPFVDVPELTTLVARRGVRSDDVPLLPAGLTLPDADVAFALDRVALHRIDLAGVALDARMRGGRLVRSPVAARLAGVPFKGSVAFDPTGRTPEATLELAGDAIDVGRWLRALGVAEDIDGHADALEVALRARGSTPRELAEHSSLEARVTGGAITVRGAANRAMAEIDVRQATLAVPAGGHLGLHVDGMLDEAPLAIEVTSGRLADFTGNAKRVPLSVTARAAGTHLSFAGDVLLPLGRGGELWFEFGGERLDTLNDLAQVELPPWGPWSMRGPIGMTATGYEVRGLEARIADNRLTGDGRLDVAGERARLDLDVTAQTIQLDDFPLPQRLTDDPPPALTAGGVRATARGVARRTERLLNAGFLRRVDAHLEVTVKEVLAGSDRLADGHLRIQVIDGRLYLGPAQVSLPGGTLSVSLAYDPTAPAVDLKAGAYVERFDYGVLARRLRPDESVRGRFSANVEIAGRAPSLEQIMLDADGRIDFAIWPEEVRGGTFNLWSVNLVNLLLAVLPVIDPGGESQVNCIVGRFDLEEGVVSDDKILIDTTRVRVRGAGSANLRTEVLDFVFRPRAKGLALFRLQNPLRVTGTLTDYRIGIDRRDLLPSTLRMLASPIIVPWEWLTLGPLPRDGADVCTDPLRE